MEIPSLTERNGAVTIVGMTAVDGLAKEFLRIQMTSEKTDGIVEVIGGSGELLGNVEQGELFA